MILFYDLFLSIKTPQLSDEISEQQILQMFYCWRMSFKNISAYCEIIGDDSMACATVLHAGFPQHSGNSFYMSSSV